MILLKMAGLSHADFKRNDYPKVSCDAKEEKPWMIVRRPEHVNYHMEQAEIFEKKQFPSNQALNHEMIVMSKRDGWKIKLINKF